MPVHCESAEFGGCEGAIRAYHLDKHAAIAVLCDAHRKLRTDILVVQWGDVVFPADRTEEIVELHRIYNDAEAAFVQRYDPAAVCCAQRGEHWGGVTSYYFSSGEIRSLCEGHYEGSSAMMSTQYYEEVYEKQFPIDDAWRAVNAANLEAWRSRLR